ncbi:MAG: hypothetical protein H0U65_12655 [Rubrobacter sp.]|nr:hypothetical protein [Rubrobacter sp.]
MSEQPRDPIEELIGQMEAAGSLIESLEEEVAQLRRDLEQANVALGAAREEVSARGRALDDRGRAQESSSEEISRLRAEMDDIKSRHADEQIRLRNEHINELAEVRRSLEEQRRVDMAAASSDDRVEGLKEELRREREALEERHQADLEALETTSQQWEEQLREGYREQEERHQAEMEAALDESEKQREELERSLRAEFEAKLKDERGAASARYEETMQALKSAAEGRDSELQKDYRAVVESQQAEIESLRLGIEAAGRRAVEERKEAANEVKKLAEGRERELKKAHSAKVAAVKGEADRRVAALQSQKEADNKALTARHAEEMIRQRREYEERLVSEDERRKQETWALEERLSDLKIQRETEMRSYNSRFGKIEAARVASESAAEENVERVVAGFGREISAMENRISEMEDALEESESLRARLEEELSGLRTRIENGKPPSLRRATRDRREAGSDASDERKLRELDARRVLAEERAQSLEAAIKKTEAERDEANENLAQTREELKKISDPAQRLRDGISLFNSSEHAKAVASISKALGLPKVHAGMDEASPSKPTLTFVWEGMAWRRYVSDPMEGVEEPRVYLSGTGEDTADLNNGPGSPRSPNARMDSKGRLMLGVQAR